MAFRDDAKLHLNALLQTLHLDCALKPGIQS